MNYFKFIFFSILFFSTCQMKGQVDDYNIRYFSTEDGLSHNVTESIYQDSRQFIWIGTQYGLNRFDGNEFKVFTKRKNGLESNDVKFILEDQQGKLWINFMSYWNQNHSKGQSISIFDVKTEQAIPFDKFFPDAPFQIQDIHFIKSDENKNIWIITKNGALFQYSKNFSLISQNENFRSISAWNIISEDEIYAHTDNNDGIKKALKINFKGEIVDSFLTNRGNVIEMGKLSDEVFWVLHGHTPVLKHKIFAYDWKGNRRNDYFNFDNAPENYSANTFQVKGEDNNIQYWHTGLKMLLVTNEKGDTLLDFSNQILKNIDDYTTLKVHKDISKNIWITSNKGLILLSPKINLFNSFLSSENSQKKMFSIRGMENFNDENIFVASYNGFFLVDKNTNEAKKIDTNWNRNITKVLPYGLGTLTFGDTILSGFHGPEFWIIDKKSLDFELVKLDPDKKRIAPSFFYKDSFHQIWAGTNLGLFQLDLEKRNILRPSTADTEHIFFKLAINHILENKNKKELLISTQQGLFSINHQGEVLEHFEDLVNFQISFLHQVNDDEFWIATKGNGLVFWNRKTEELQLFTKEQGLTHDYIYSIHEDEFGFFWLPSNDGLMRFDPKDFSIITFNESDGIANSEFNSFSHLVTEDGQMYFGGINGVTTFHPRDFQFLESQDISLDIISSKKLKQGAINFTDFDMSNEIYFEPSDKSIALDFCLFDYPNSFQSKYAYQIEGYDSEWNYLDRNQLIINRLPYGDYVLKVKAQGGNGVWSNQVLNIPLHILKPFYVTWQFIVLALLALSGLLYWLVRWRIDRLEKRNLALESIVADRTKELADLNKTKDQFFAIIAHDMRGLVLSFKNISQKVGFLRRKGREDEVTNFLQSIDKSADSLSNLLDNLLNWALVEKGVFPHHPEYFNLEKIVLENIKLFTQLSRIKEIELSYNVHETLNLYADKNAVSTIIRNLLNNAIKFSKPGDKVNIEAIQNKENIIVQVMDNGQGIASAKLENIFELDSNKTKQGTIGEKGIGLGLLLCKELVELNEGEIRIESEEGKGTNVSIEFPLVA